MGMIARSVLALFARQFGKPGPAETAAVVALVAMAAILLYALTSGDIEKILQAAPGPYTPGS